jgi:ribosomal protein S3
MAQKANPISLRLQYTNRYFDNSWYSKKYYDKLVTKDIHIQKYINTFLKLVKLPLARFSIQYLPKKTRIFSFFCYPKISRSIRSKMFGVYVPHFFKEKKNRGTSRNKKYSSTDFRIKSIQLKNRSKSLTNQDKRSLAFNLQNNTKFLYNKNLITYSILNLLETNKSYFNYNKLNTKVDKNLEKKNEKWAKNLFFFNNCFNSRLKLDEKATENIQKLEYGKFLKNFHYNLIFDFLKIIFNLVTQNEVKVQRLNHLKAGIKKKTVLIENKRIKNMKLYRLQAKILFKHFLILNNLKKNIYQNEKWLSLINQDKQNLISQDLKIKKNNIKRVALFNTKLLNFLSNNSVSFLNNNIETNSSRYTFNKETNLIETPNFNDSIINQMSVKTRNLLYAPFLNALNPKTNVQNILELVPKEKISLANAQINSKLLQDLCFIYVSNPLENNQMITLSNKWKLYNIENRYKYKNYIQRNLSGIYNLDFEFIPFRVKNDWQSAGFLADEIAYFLERRVPFRRFKNKLLKYISKYSQIRGIRITCSGRVGGKSKKAQRAKTECVKLGQTSLHVFSNQIDFATRTAQTSFGSVGVKVWISYNQ